MNRIFAIIGTLGFVGLCVPPALAQDGNRRPETTIVRWEVSQDVGPTVVYDRDLGIGSRFEISQFLHQELDIVLATVEVIDPDWTEGGDEEDAGEEVYLRFTAEGLEAFSPPPPVPISGASMDFFGADPENGFLPTGDPPVVRFQFFIVVPEFNGRNQDRLRGLIDFDVRWVVSFAASNDEEIEEDEEDFIIEDSVFLSAIENPILAAANPQAQADAGPDQTVAVGATVTLDGSRTFDGFNVGFDPGNENIFEKDDVTFAWEYIAGPVVVEPEQETVSEPTATVTLAVPGVYEYRLLVDDNVNAVPTTDTVLITVVESLPTPNPPSAVIMGPAAPVPVGTIVTLDGTGTTDPDCDPDCEEALSFRWRQTNALFEPITEFEDGFIALTALNQPVTRWQANLPGEYYFRLLVEDGNFVSSATYTVRVIPAATGGETVDDIPAADDSPSIEDNLAPLSSAVPGLCGAGLMPLAIAPLVLGMWRIGRRR